MDLAVALDPLYQQNRELGKKRQGAMARLRPRYMQALLAKAGGLVAPDANSTLRVTFGTVKGKVAADGTAWTPFTTLRGIEQKHTGKGEFDAPDRRARGDRGPAGREADAVRPPRDRRRAGRTSSRRSTPPAATRARPPSTARASSSACSSTGPTTPSRPTSSSTPVNTRSIHADVRYMLWVMSEVDGASHLVREMGVE